MGTQFPWSSLVEHGGSWAVVVALLYLVQQFISKLEEHSRSIMELTSTINKLIAVHENNSADIRELDTIIHRLQETFLVYVSKKEGR